MLIYSEERRFRQVYKPIFCNNYMKDYPPRDYEERIERSKIRAFHDILAESVSRVHGPSIIVSTSIASDKVCIRNLPSRLPSKVDLERNVFILRNDILPHAIAYLLHASKSGDYYRDVLVQDSFSCPAGQMPSVVKAINDVANYHDSDFRMLPFYAKVIMRAHPRFN